MKTEKCTHCHKPIVCKVDDISNCDCQKVELLDETVKFLYEKTQHDCLCNDCLKKFDELTKFSLENKFPKRPTEMVEGLHFYMENGYFVFTELYHYLKGCCCKNGCRHCVYGIHKNSWKEFSIKKHRFKICVNLYFVAKSFILYFFALCWNKPNSNTSVFPRPSLFR